MTVYRSAATYAPETALEASAGFMNHATAANIIAQTLIDSGRIGKGGVVQPLEVERHRHDPAQWIVGPKVDSEFLEGVIIPNPDKCLYTAHNVDGTVTRNSIVWSAPGNVYRVLTAGHRIQLSAAEVQDLLAERERMEQVVPRRYGLEESTAQLDDAYHLRRNQLADREFASTRLYIAGGIAGTGIVRRLVEEGADFSYAKVWQPGLHTGRQEFRLDVPIVEVETFRQLRSVVDGLRQLHADGHLSAVQHKYTALGVPVGRLPGVRLAQSGGRSFNGVMSRLLGDALYPAVSAAEHLYDKEAGRVSRQWLDEVARFAVHHAQAHAAENGIDPTNHAFLSNQPKDKILAVIS